MPKTNSKKFKKRLRSGFKTVVVKTPKITTNLTGKGVGKPAENTIDKNITSPPASSIPPIFRYIKSDPGPFKAIVALKSVNTQKESTKPSLTVEVSLLNAAYVFHY